MNNDILAANLNSLSKTNLPVFSRLNAFDWNCKKKRYTFCEAKNGEKVPLYTLPQGNSKPLHSIIDPKREALRLVSAIINDRAEGGDTGFIVLLGLGGGFVPQTVLEQTQAQVLVIDFCFDEIAELFLEKDYSSLLNNERFTLLIDPASDEIKNYITEHYKPSLHGSIQTLPLRTRTEFNLSLFNDAIDAVQEAIEIVSSDFSVQAHFGRRWFSNIIRNVKFAGAKIENSINNISKTPIAEIAITAAGPSLNKQLSVLAEYKSRNVFIISSDTALPVLLHYGIEPDAVVSIDCQHISYYHFVGCNLRGIPLILDIASPPLLSSFAEVPCFFSSSHPLALYISKNWQGIPLLDTSGGNVTYACLSFAQMLGTKQITLFGADFSYVNSETYARGTYIYPFFEKKQSRLSPKESLLSSFLYRSPFIPAERNENINYYETSSLRFYRKKLEEKASTMSAQIICAKGDGAPVNLQKTARNTKRENTNMLTEKNEKISGIDFLEKYRAGIAALPPEDTGNYFQSLNAEKRQIFTTLLPYAAYIRRRSPLLKTNDIIEEVKRLSISEIDRVLNSRQPY